MVKSQDPNNVWMAKLKEELDLLASFLFLELMKQLDRDGSFKKGSFKDFRRGSLSEEIQKEDRETTQT